MEVIAKLDRTMPRYPECVWSGAEESEHIEIVGKLRKMSEGMGNHRKLWKTLEGAEASERMAGDREDFGRCV